MSLQIAIDGPIGSGKSTVAKLVAELLGIMLVDAGALYRTAAYIAQENGLSAKNDVLKIAGMFRKAKVVERKPTKAEQDGRNITVMLDGKDISWKIRTARIDALVAEIANNKEIIDEVHEKEEQLARFQDVVIEGREIGTMVLPRAQVKIYMTADARVRAQRRTEQYRRQGEKGSIRMVMSQMKQRDELDMRRPWAPLRRADDAVLIDTTNISVDEAAEKIISLIPAKLRNSKLQAPKLQVSEL